MLHESRQVNAQCPGKCVGCSVALPRTAKHRILCTPSSRHVKAHPGIFRDCRAKMPWSVRETCAWIEGSVSCVPCFRRLGGILKLRRQLAEKEKVVEDAMDHAILTSHVPVAPSPVVTTLPPICTPLWTREDVISGLTPSRGHRIDAPTRRRCVRRIDTPARRPIVAVSVC